MDAMTVAQIWSTFLEDRQVAEDDDFFFDLGGHSLLAAAIISVLSQETRLPLELKDLYLYPTPREFSAHTYDLRKQLTALTEQIPDNAEWDLNVFLRAFAELGAVAADSLLPQRVVLEYVEPDDPGARNDMPRLALLRQIRGRGTCEVREDHIGVTLRRGDTWVQVNTELGTTPERVRFTEARQS